MKINATGTAGVLAIGALTVGAFAAGTHLGPRPQGHNLYQPTLTAPVRSPLTLTAAKSPAAVAQNGADTSPGDDADTTGDFSSDGPAATFQQVYLLVKRHYVDPLPTDAKFGHGAAAAMVASLQDPDSRFLEAPEVAELNAESQGHYHGAGAALAVRRIAHVKTADIPAYTEYRLTVVAPLPGSPAEKAGLHPGDTITTLNGQWIYNDEWVYTQTKALKALQDDPVSFNKLVTALQKKIDGSMSLADAQTKLEDPAVKSLTLTVTRAGTAQPIPVTLDTSAETTVPAVTSRSLPGGIGYIKINQLTTDSDKEFAAALAGFGTDPKGLVLDLRDCPGGLLEAGASIAAHLTSAQALGYVETKGQKIQTVAIAPGTKVTCPIAVLVNGGTANTAEMLAAALQSGGAKLIGTKTFGDASDVKLIVLRDGAGFTMTVGKLMTNGHTEFGGQGIKPDVVAPDTPGSDMLDRAVGVLSGRVARLPIGSI